MSYAFPPGGLPGQNVNPEGTAVFRESYAVIPAICMRDIVTSFLPGWLWGAGPIASGDCGTGSSADRHSGFRPVP